MPTDLERWKSRQVNALVARGINPIDAANAVRDFLAHLPPGADPDTYIRSAQDLEQDITRSEIRADANAAWYEQAPAQFKRILDAGEGN